MTLERCYRYLCFLSRALGTGEYQYGIRAIKSVTEWKNKDV